MPDSLGDRIKRYEAAYTHTLTPRSPLIIRVDGRAFHTYTRGMKRPFDHELMDSMVYATQRTAADMQGFKLGYTQSDEATFLLTDYDNLDTQGWFGYELNKVVSLSASIFTAHFNYAMDGYDGRYRVAHFYSRAFNVPRDDVPNVFLWRQRDWERNSLQMLCRAHFSHKQLDGKGRREMHDMLHSIGINWADLSPRLKNGTFVLRDGDVASEKLTYQQIAEFIDNATEKQTA